MNTIAPNASLRLAIWSTGAMSPSIEKTPSLITRIFFAQPSASLSARSRSPMSEWR